MRINWCRWILQGPSSRPSSGLFEFQICCCLPLLRSPPTTMSFLEPASVSPLPEGITDPNYKPLPGRLGNLTPGQQHALDTLRQQLVDEGHFVPERMDDATLLRYVVGPCTHIHPSVHGAIGVDGRCDVCVHASKKRVPNDLRSPSLPTS